MRQDVLDLAAIRAQHTLLVLKILWHEDVSRIELSRRVGLSRSAISNIVAELLEARLVEEVGRDETRAGAGRRATMLHLCARAAHLIAVDLGARHLRVALLDLRCCVLDFEERPHDITSGPAATYREIERLLHVLLGRSGITLEQVAMIGVGVPGPVDHYTGKVVRPPNMTNWDGENVSAALGARFPVPIAVDNDANLGALAEWRFGGNRGTPDLIYIKAAKGIGAGILLGGKLYRGARGGAGEIGHISINEMGPRGRSGNPGSLESYAAADIVVANMRAKIRATRDSCLQSTSSLSDLLRLAEHDTVARDVWQETGRHIGVAITTVLNLFNPSVVVIGGQLALAGTPLIDSVREVVRDRALLISRDSVIIDLSRLGPDVGVLGAGAMMLEELFTPHGLRRLYRVSGANAPPDLPAFGSTRTSTLTINSTLRRDV